MDYKNLSKKELIILVSEIRKMIDDASLINTLSNVNTIEKSSIEKNNELETLIGTIPFLLLNQKYFEKNQDIADFAESLGIHVPSPEKKKKEDIIGRIVSAIARFDRNKISELNNAIKSIKHADNGKEKSNFFTDWQNAIKKMKI